MDAKSFQQVAAVSPSSDLTYSTMVSDLSHFFRIKAMHTDGTPSYSSLVEVMDDFKHVRPAFPNPASSGEMINIDVFMKNVADVQVQVYDLSGKVIIQQKFSSVSGLNTYDLDVSTLPPGMYLLSVNGGYFSENQLITVK